MVAFIFLIFAVKQLLYGLVLVVVASILSKLLIKPIANPSVRKGMLIVSYVVVYSILLLGLSTFAKFSDGYVISFHALFGLIGFIWIFKEIKGIPVIVNSFFEHMVALMLIINAAFLPFFFTAILNELGGKRSEEVKQREYSTCSTQCHSKMSLSPEDLSPEARYVYYQFLESCLGDCQAAFDDNK